MQIHYGLDHFKAQKPVVTIGTFDGVHQGHQQVIHRLKEIAKSVGGETVIFTFYPHPRLIISPRENTLRLLTTKEEKIIQLQRQKIDHLVIFPFDKDFAKLQYSEFVSQILVEQMGMHHLVIGYDHKLGRDRKGDFHSLTKLSKELNFSIAQLDVLLVEDVNVSSTKIRRALDMGEIERANHYLGYNYTLTGTVIEGNQLGRKINFPTANIQTLDPHKLIPGFGVYAVRVKIGEEFYLGMLNIGTRPTVNINADNRSIEVHIFDFAADIYHAEITLHFEKKIRNEQKFETLDALKEQLIKDREAAKKILKHG